MAINIPIISSLNTKGFDSAKKQFQSLQGFGSKSGFLLQKAMLPAAAAVTALAGGLVIAAKAAISDEQSTKLLERQLRATLGPNQALADSVADFVDQTQLATGVADDELRPALAGLVRYTKDASKAQDLLTLSLDISQATGKDLAAVSTALGRAFDGNFTALKKLGIPLDENIIKTKDFDAAQKALSSQFAGASAANALTFAGRIQILKVRFDEMVEAIGYKVLPFFGKLLDYVDRLVKIMGQSGLGAVLNDLMFKFIELSTKALVSVTNAFTKLLGSIVKIGGGLKDASDGISVFELAILRSKNGFKELYKETKAWSELMLLLEADVKAANYQLAVEKEQQRLLNIETIKSANSTKAATAAAKKATEASAKQAESVRKLKDAYDNAVETVKDKFSPALAEANKQLTDATDIYNGFYNATADVVRSIFNVGDAWTTAADSEGAKSFFDVLDEQARKAGQLSKGIENLIEAGLDDPALLQSILAAGADVGLEIIKGLLAGGKASIDRLVGISTTINAAADRIAKLTADKWYKSGIDQAQQIVNGVNSVIANTEFLLKFAVDPASVALISEQLDAGLGTVFQGGAAPVTNPFGPVLGSINASPNMDGSRVSTSNVTINVQGGDPNAVVNALRAYMRQNGSVPIRVASIG